MKLAHQFECIPCSARDESNDPTLPKCWRCGTMMVEYGRVG